MYLPLLGTGIMLIQFACFLEMPTREVLLYFAIVVVVYKSCLQIFRRTTDIFYILVHL